MHCERDGPGGNLAGLQAISTVTEVSDDVVVGVTGKGTVTLPDLGLGYAEVIDTIAKLDETDEIKIEVEGDAGELNGIVADR